jgi:hypothetical protein
MNKPQMIARIRQLEETNKELHGAANSLMKGLIPAWLLKDNKEDDDLLVDYLSFLYELMANDVPDRIKVLAQEKIQELKEKNEQE